MVDDDDDDESPSPQPRMDSRSALSREVRAWRLLHIVKIKEKDSSRFTIWSRRQALKPLERADLESVWGSGEGDSTPSSSSTILLHQFHDAHRRA